MQNPVIYPIMAAEQCVKSDADTGQDQQLLFTSITRTEGKNVIPVSLTNAWLLLPDGPLEYFSL